MIHMKDTLPRTIFQDPRTKTNERDRQTDRYIDRQTDRGHDKPQRGT